jgi:RimJ/RimL family protein N-acetyltransferase
MFARTQRLLLRPGWAEDAPALAAAIGDEAILTKLARAPSPYRIRDAAAFLALPRETLCPDFLIFARTDSAPRLIGGVGLAPDGDDAELGYWIARPFWGQGYATEAARAVVDIARHTLRKTRLLSAHYLDNPESGRVLRKLGFKPTGEIVARNSRARGAAVPTRLFRLELSEGSGDRGTAHRLLAA